MGSVMQSADRSHEPDEQPTQATGARSPSVRRKISPTRYSERSFVSLYPPPFPCTPSRSPFLTRTGSICSRYFSEMLCRFAISFIGTYPVPSQPARSIITRRAYLPLVDIIMALFLTTRNVPRCHSSARSCRTAETDPCRIQCRFCRNNP